MKDGEGESKIPNGFKSIIPSDTEILSIEYENSLIKVNFSSL
ncbi:MAG: GerMN domain-containing protein [Clostridia bacterium]|nr:GerMN domain-containing protein [Clostridia bacterium]